ITNITRKTYPILLNKSTLKIRLNSRNNTATKSIPALMLPFDVMYPIIDNGIAAKKRSPTGKSPIRHSNVPEIRQNIINLIVSHI
ncbi:MAG: hypothetical protein K2N71_04655, partial [Oscillospiraceae bacterium]|nr:hypothetical protein [Oscillospiraceae bacterium]